MSDTVIDEIAIGGETGAKWGGLNTAVQDPRFLPIGVSPNQNNWLTGRLQDNIQLRRGQLLLGQTRRNTGHATGLGVGFMASSQIAYYSANNNLYHYNPTTQDTEEVGTNVLAGANGEDVWFQPYQNFAGFFMYFGSAHTSIFKIPLANPTSVVNQTPLQWFANASIDQGRMFGMGKYNSFGAPDLNNSYISNADKSAPSSYTPTTNETEGTGNGVTKTFSGTLAGLGGPLTAFGVLIGGALTAGENISDMTESGGLVTITTSSPHGLSQGQYTMALGVTAGGSNINGVISVVTFVNSNTEVTVSPYTAVSSLTYGSGGTLYPLEVFQDNQQGVLTSNLGGTGTINYATGAFNITFNTAPVTSVAIIGNYYTESADSGGILDFSFAASDQSIGQGYLLLQGASGPLLASSGFQGIEYQFHLYRTWNVSLPSDTAAGYDSIQNNQYWSQLGIPYSRAQSPTGDGILLLDNTYPSTPKFSILSIPPGSTNLTVVPTWISKDLDLSAYDFSTAVTFRWGEYNILACQALVNGKAQGFNSVFFAQDIESGIWNQLDYTVTSLADFQGALLSGDSLSPNAFVLFSGTDDDANIIENFWDSSLIDLGIQGQKKVRYFYIQGLIQRPQAIKLSYGINGGGLVPAATTNLPGGIILGTGSYVNSSTPVGVGSNTLGSTTIGAGQIFALPFEIQIPIMTDYFEYIQIQFQALGIGWAQINKFGFRDIRHKSLKATISATIEP